MSSVNRFFLVLSLGLTSFLISMQAQGITIMRPTEKKEVPKDLPNSEWCNYSKNHEQTKHQFGYNWTIAHLDCRKGKLTDERVAELSRPGYCFQEMTYENLKFYFDEGWFEVLRACDYERIHIKSVLYSLQDSTGDSPRGYCNKGGTTFEKARTQFGNDWIMALAYCKDDTYFIRYYRDHFMEIHDYCTDKVIYESLKVSYGEEDWLKALVCGDTLECDQDQRIQMDHILRGDIDSLYRLLSMEFIGETAGYPEYIQPPIMSHQVACEFEQVLRESTGQEQRPVPWLNFAKINSKEI